MTSFLLCPPDYYGVHYEINPWMHVRRKVDLPLARRQWEALYQVITMRLGIQALLIPPVKGLPDMVFTANAGVVAGKLFVASSFRHTERRAEKEHFRRWFQGKGYTIEDMSKGLFFEGEGDVLGFGQTLFGGYHFRSDIRSHLRLAELLGKRVISLELIDPYFYHLDTCFCPLDTTSALYYPGAFDDYGRRALQEHLDELMEVEEAEAHRFGCNAVVVDRQVVLPSGCPKLKAALEQRGYGVHETDLSEFLKAGGSAKCLTLRLS